MGQNMCVQRAGSGPRGLDRRIADLAARQHGVVTRGQLRHVGLSDPAISRRVHAGRLHRVHTGVFAVGHALLGPRGRWRAAVLHCGPDAVLSHSSAAALWEIRFSAAASVDVTIPRTGRRSRDHIRVHRPRVLGAAETTTRHGIPVTTPERTILDMAAILQRAHLERLLDQAEIRELTDYAALADLATARNGHRGAAKLKRAVEQHLAGNQLTRSDLEALFRQLCRDHGLPEPRVNRQVAGHEVDFLFADERLIVETDSWRYHRTRRAFEDDRARDAHHAALGYRTLRVTDRQLTHDAPAIAATVRRLLTPDQAAIGQKRAGKHDGMRRFLIAILAGVVLLVPAALAAPAGAQEPSTSTIATGLQVPWGLTFLPDRSALVSERVTGRIWRISPNGSKRVAMRVPGVDTNAGEGGLLGLAVSPTYARDHLVYAYLTTSSDNRIVRFRLGGTPHAIVTGIRRGAIHNGGRIAFGPDGKLYAGVGETGDRGLAQVRSAQNGKILRMNPNGSIPSDNPFSHSRVWSWGHRNVQGLAWDSSKRLWATEFGQDRFDEVNLIRKGRNYGWPTVEGTGSTQGGRFVNPLVTWPTSQASPSGDAIVGSTLYVATLQGRRLYRIPIEGTKLGTPTSLLAGGFGRLRTVAKAPDGSLWVMTSNRDGRGRPRSGDDRIVRVAIGS